MNMELLGTTSSLAFLPFLIPALIGGVASVAGTVISNNAAKKNAAKQNAANEQQATQQYAYDKEAAAEQYANQMKTMELQRQWDLEDRQHAIDNPVTIKSDVDYKALAKSAEEAGFNPLTAVRSGGSAGFTNTSQPSTPLSRTAPTMQAVSRQAPGRVVARQQGYGDAIGSFLDPILNGKAREMEARLVEAQIANLHASTKQIKFGDVPSYTAGNRAIQMGSDVAHGQTFQSITQRLPASAGVSQTPEVGQPTVTNPARTGSTWWHVDPAQPDAAAFEERYGEPGDWFGGAWNATTDVIYNARRALTGAWQSIPPLSREKLKNPPAPRQFLREVLGGVR